ncbi:MAG: hypothetical protein D6718_13580, partial [Acidobacteria bacterium]
MTRGAPLADGAVRDRMVREHGRSLACEAGAGTGKTTLLVERILRGLAEGAFRAPELVAITFTRKAARELRERVRSRIAREARESAGGPVAERLRRARRELPLARICTIHAFCRRVLSQYAFEAGLDPGFQVVEEGLDRMYARELWQEWLAARLAEPDGLPALTELVGRGIALADLWEVARFALENPDLRPAGEPAGSGDEDALWTWLAERVRGFRGQVESALQEGAQDRLAGALRALDTEIERLGRLPARARSRWLLDRLDGGTVKLPFVTGNIGSGSNYRDRGVPARIRADWRRFREEAAERLLEVNAPLVLRAASEIDAFRRWARERRRDRGLLSQVDLLYETRKLLRNDAGVRRRLRREIRALMVDEHQDTDPLQVDIVESLAEGEGGPVLFVVGDPKQSIYRFRRADVGCYQRQIARFESRGDLGRIGTNFRSRPELLEAINRVGREIFDPGRWPRGQADWQDLEPCPPDARPGGLAGPALALLPIDETGSADARAEAEARAVASVLLAAREHEKVPWREMAVLFRTASRARLLEDILDEAGVPYRQERSQHFYRRLEIAELVQVLESVADPWDATRAVAAMRSRLLAVTDEALFRHVRAGGSLAPAERRDAGDPDVKRALERLAAWARRAREMSPPRLVEEILRESGYLLLLETLRDGRRAAGNLAKLLDIARVHWREKGLDLPGLVREFRSRLGEEQAREPEAPEAEDEDRVTLLTIHGAKGLEWDLVALYDVAAGSSRRTPAACAGVPAEGSPPETFEVRLQKGFASPGFAEADERNRELDRAERARLVYVALTRARCRVAIPCYPGTEKLDAESVLGILRLSPSFRRWEEAAGAGEQPPEPWLAFGSPPAAPPGPARRLDLGDPAEGRSRRAAWERARRELLERADRRVLCIPSDLHAGSGEDSGKAAAGPRDSAQGRRIGRAVHEALRWLVTGLLDDPREAVRRAAAREGLD